jgi:hypothetical protein
MGYEPGICYGLWGMSEVWDLISPPTWWTPKCMGYDRVWVMTAMGYDRVVCTWYVSYCMCISLY